jgi:hypothetical protein
MLIFLAIIFPSLLKKEIQMIMSVLKRNLVLVISIIFLVSTHVYAQDEDESLNRTLQDLSADVAKKYVAPISSGFGTNLNAGWFHTAPEPVEFGFNLEFGLVAMGSFFPNDAKHFETNGRLRLNAEEAGQLADLALEDYSGVVPKPIVKAQLINEITSQYTDVQVSGATIIGNQFDSLTINFPGATYMLATQTYDVPTQQFKLGITGIGDLADVNFLPLFAPQLNIGTIYGTSLTFRYVPDIKLDDELGSFKYFGFGIQHNPGLWLKNELPFNFAASFYTQSLEFGSLLSTNTWAFGLNASKRLGLPEINVTPYMGFMIESATMQVTYDYIVEVEQNQFEVEKIRFDIEGENRTRLTMGLSIRLLLININADYNIGQYNSFSVGLNLKI